MAEADAAADAVRDADAEPLANDDAVGSADGISALRQTGVQPPTDAFHAVSGAQATPGGADDRTHTPDDELAAEKPAAHDPPHGAARVHPSVEALYAAPGAHAA